MVQRYLKNSSWKDGKGDVVKVRNAYTKEWQGKAQMNIGTRSMIEKAEPGELPEYKPGAGVGFEIGEAKTLSEIVAGDKSVHLLAKVLSINEKTISQDDLERLG